MRVLVIQNFAGTGLGQIEAALAERGAAIDLRRAHEGDALPDSPAGHAGIVVLGGGQNALADDQAPWFPQLLSLMRGFAESDRPLLGVCLGAQLLARAYGADNLIGAAPEFGWQHVSLTPEGLDDPVLSAAGAEFPIFQWHDDTFTLPRGARRLAGNDAAHNQAFRIGRAGYATQFHFEADRRLVAEWNETFRDWLAERQPGWAARHDAEAALSGPAADAAGMAIARAWAALL
jgi:GMP synthase-like glutamine amidotransferase